MEYVRSFDYGFQGENPGLFSIFGAKALNNLQALLFTSAHVYLAGQFPPRFWLFIPAAALLLGLLACLLMPWSMVQLTC